MTWRLPDREDRHVAVLWLACAVSAVALRSVWLSASAFLPSCPFHHLTGWPCPGCGTSRAMVRLLNADVLGALALNPLAACGAIAFVTGGVSAPLWLACGGCVPRVTPRPKPFGAALLAAAFLINWVWLIARGV